MRGVCSQRLLACDVWQTLRHDDTPHLVVSSARCLRQRRMRSMDNADLILRSPSEPGSPSGPRQLAPRHQGNPSEGERLVRRLASWCRANRVDAMAATAVPGPTEVERASLAALGGVAASLIGRPILAKAGGLPPAVVNWMRRAPHLSTELLDDLRKALNNGEDPLSQVYERLVAAPRRRPLGTFFTPGSIYEYMTDLVRSRLTADPVTIADPGAGVGAFTKTALVAWPKAQVHAIDVNVVTLGLLAATPAMLSRRSRRVTLHHIDFLEWLSNFWPSEPGPRLILGNPPYTRHQSLNARSKADAQRAAGDLAPGGRAGLSTYFLAASLASLGESDSLCLLLPANWLEAEYAARLRSYLWHTTDRPVELHIFPHTLNLFPVAVVTAMVIWVGPRQTKSSPLVVHHLNGNLSSAFTSRDRQTVARTGKPPSTFIFDKARANRRNRPGKTVPLASIARVRRGVATGANHFFLLTDNQAERLPSHTYVPAATRLRELEADCLDVSVHDAIGAAGLRRWMLWLKEEDASDPAVSLLLDHGKCQRVHESYLCADRNPWYALERIPVPDILFGPMTKGNFRVIENVIGAIPTNTFYGIRFLCRPTDTSTREELAAWLRGRAGQNALSAVARQHGSGTLKIEPRDLAELRVPAKIAQALDPT